MGAGERAGAARFGLLTLVGAIAIALLAPHAAPAATTRLPVGSPITGSGTTGVLLHAPYGIGIDEATGNVFVADGTGGNYVAIYGAEGGLPTGVASPYKITGFAFAGEPTQPAIDNAATSPSLGTLYIGDVFRNKLKKYVRNPATQLYELKGELNPEPGVGVREPKSAAVDGEGNVYAVSASSELSSPRILKFGPTGTVLAAYTKDTGSAFSNIAIDAAGDVFVATYHNDCCGGQIFKFPADGLGGLGGKVEVSLENGIWESSAGKQDNPLADGIVVDPARNQLFVAVSDRILQFNATTLAKEGEFGVGVLENAKGIAVNSKTNRVYVADNGTTKRVVVFGAEVPAPTATTKAASDLGPSSATLNGIVNPTGVAVSECKFEYLTDTAYKENKGKYTGAKNAPATIPCAQSLPADSADHPVSAALGGLTAGTTYHFRLKAANANGPYAGADATFTPLADEPVKTKAATGVKGTAATLNGTINPAGEAVSECRFEYLTDAAYKANGSSYSGANAPATQACEGSVPADEADHEVSAQISGLIPNATTYHFRLVANVGGTTSNGQDKMLETATTVKTNAATEVNATNATLNGSIEPESTTISECRFEYLTDAAYKANGSSYSGANAPATQACEGSVPADEGTHPVSAVISGLSANTTYHFRLSAQVNGGTASGADQSFGLLETVVTLPATAVGAEAATLNGTVNPNGKALSACFFEYGTTTAYGQTAPCLPDPEGIGSGESPVPVSATVSLHPGTTYHFRLAVDQEGAPILGQDKSLQTLGPVIVATFAEDVVRKDATIGAEVDPEGAATTYRFEWGTTSAYGNSSPELPVGSDSSTHTVRRALEGLEAGTTYHYRVIATSSASENEGPDRTLVTYASAAADTDCPNAALRTGASAALPDCRAYEMVSPVDKENGDIKVIGNGGAAGLNRSSLAGTKLAYASARSFGDASSAPLNTQYIAARTSEGWRTHAISPARTTLITGNAEAGGGIEYQALSEDLCQGWLVPQGEPPLAEDAIAGYLNIYRRSDDLCGPESYEAITTGRPEYQLPDAGIHAYEPKVQGVAADGQITAFQAEDSLEGSGAPPQADCMVENEFTGCLDRVYVKEAGQAPRFVCVLPGGGAPSQDCSTGTASLNSVHLLHALSVDGKRIFWSLQNGNSTSIYLRENPLGTGGECTGGASPCTIAVSEAVEEDITEGEVKAIGSIFRTAAPDGSVALFTTSSSAGGFTNHLYEFEVASEETNRIAGKMTGFFGASEDAQRVYFASEEILTLGEPNSEGAEPLAGQPNLYLHEAGAGSSSYRFIGTLVGGEGGDIPTGARVSKDGLTLTFVSKAPLTGYDNVDASSGKAVGEVFVYDAAANGGAGELTCVSCRASGARPEGSGRLPLAASESGWIVQQFAANLAPLRSLASDGDRLFFESADAVLPRDSNGKIDVYEWERIGTGGCTETASNYFASAAGCVDLISSGQSNLESQLVDASSSGDDVFIGTIESLLPQDYGLRDIYDARVEGGFPQPPAPPAACEGEACQGPSEAPNDPTPASLTFEGAGNVFEGAVPAKKATRCAKGKVKRRGHCVAKKNRKHGKKAKSRRRHDGRTGR